MGHANLRNFSELITKYLYTGKKTLKQMVEYAIKNKCWVMASEGEYADDESMTVYGVMNVLYLYINPQHYFYREHILAKPIPAIEVKGPLTLDQVKAYEKWSNGDIDYDDNDYKTLLTIEFGFTHIGRRLYLSKKLPLVTNHTT